MNETGISPLEALIWVGTAISLLGLLALIYCIARISRAKRRGLDDETMRLELKKVVPINLGALFFSVIGLMIVIVGIFLA